MLDYFCEQVSCPEIPTICAKLGNLKKRITLGDYTTPKKEFDECQCLFDAIQQRAITSKNEPLAVKLHELVDIVDSPFLRFNNNI